ncbi:probable cytochrome P450 6a13 isoform X2 [Daktulosphaira vitifoliae]|uniref:probable cytochrome P450 6a13 isoform X2 n=1 Tax=Daktulosphaira vitifoliae TaxID=58002 RepID=UPI0021AAC055|nr:probable cytochrome P450 6a13 isoform X2 [Daktulosphaira vitifoliae]
MNYTHNDTMLSSVVFLITSLCVIATLFLYKKITHTYSYWKRKSVIFAEPLPFFGNIKDAAMFKLTQGQCLQNIYNEFPNEKYVGIYQFLKPTLLLRDPETIKIFTVKNFAHFTDRGFSYDGHREPLTNHLVNMEGDMWKILRQKLTPAFSSGKIKNMMGMLRKCGEQLIEHIEKGISAGVTDYDMRDLTAKYTTDVIGTCAFGLNCNSLTDTDSEFRQMGNAVLNSSISLAIAKAFRVFFPKMFNILNLRTFPIEVQKFFLAIVKQTIAYRRDYKIQRDDFIQLLLEMKSNQEFQNDEKQFPTIELTEELIAAQVFVFFLAGFETSSTTLSFCLHELALNPDIQLKVQMEIADKINKDGLPFTYESVISMEFLEQCIKETMRKYPPVQALVRKCTKPFQLPDSKAVIDEGTGILIPVYGIHHDPKYYPEPEVFDPNRFKKEEITKRPTSSYLPFGDGPRTCIDLSIYTGVPLVSRWHHFQGLEIDSGIKYYKKGKLSQIVSQS